MRIRDGSSDVCSSDLAFTIVVRVFAVARMRHDDQTIALEPPADAAAQASAAFVEIESVLPRRPDVDLMELRRVEVAAVKADAVRSQERSVGKECVGTCRSRGSTVH